MKRRVFFLTYLVYAGSYVCRKNLAVSMPVMGAELGFDEFALARIVFCYSLLYTFGQFAHGIFADRYGPKAVVGFGLSWAIAANLGMGAFSTLAPFVFLAGLNGFGQASGWPSLAKHISYWYRREERGVVMAWWQTNYILGGLFATVLATLIMTQLGWRRAFLLPPLLLGVIVIAYLVFCPVQPRHSRRGVLQYAPTPGRDNRRRAAEEQFRTIFMDVVRQPMAWVIGAMYFSLKMIVYCFIYWMPLYMVKELAYSPGEAGLTSSLLELGGVGGALIAGYASDRLFKARRMPVGAIMLWCLALALFFFPLLSASGRIGNGIAICLVGLCAFGPESLLAGSASLDIGGEKRVGGVAGFVNCLGSLGQVCSPFLAAWAAAGSHWDTLFRLFALAALLAGVVLASKWNYVPRTTA